MSKSIQEQIREMVARHIFESWFQSGLYKWEYLGDGDELKAGSYKRADELLSKLTELGAVPLDKDQTQERLICSRIDECGYKADCGHAKPHNYSAELCRQFAYATCACCKLRKVVNLDGTPKERSGNE
ncbi:MAG: hypothetical protein MUP81_02945 [Dehalococcoidia bacterium]|nr:hypothetical protein [Dehalococcoidia bacterium]